MHVYIGTYTQDRREGIFHFHFDGDTGKLTPRSAVGGVENPSFLALHPTGRFLYSVAETGAPGGAAAFVIAPGRGDLTRLNRQPSGGGGACHIAVDRAGTTAVVSNYGGGSVASFPLGPDGRLGPVATFIQHEGSSVDPERQEAPHAHSTNFDAAGRFAVTADLGLDQLRIYELDPATSRLKAHAPPFTPTHPGAGPRHFAFHPRRPVAYVINELDATLTTVSWDAEAGRLESLQTIGTLPPGFGGRRSTAEVVVHPNGRFVYGSNRGHDSLAIFAVDPNDGTLKPVGHVPSGGAEPRNFNLDPTGRWLIACNQNSHDVQVFSVGAEAGGLTPVGEPVSVPMPVCVRFLAAAY